MSDYFFDTTVFVDWSNQNPAALALIDEVMGGRKTASYSPISYVELFQYANRSREEELAFFSLSRLLNEAPLTISISMAAGQTLRPLTRNQRRALLADAIIAATAESRNETIYTRNPRDIRRFYTNVQVY
jgi:predicted nucleic acid-binding protein